MKALTLLNIKEALQYIEAQKPSITNADEVIVQIQAAAINHRDVYITQGLYAGIQTPAILGSDGVGIVVEAGENAQEWLQKSVIINPNCDWGNNDRVQGQAYKVLGMPSQGTMSEFIKLNKDRLAEKPVHLSIEEAAALPLAGLTAYRALIGRAQAQSGERVLISGVGGGVALNAMQFAIALGMEVWVTSGKDEKIQKAISLGAKGGVNYKTPNWHKTLMAEAKGGFDVIIDSAGGEGFGLFMDIANPAARIAFYGGTLGKSTFSPQRVFWKQIDILGCTMGNDKEFAQMVALVDKFQIRPIVDSVYNMTEGQAAFDYLDSGLQFGKVVLKP